MLDLVSAHSIPPSSCSTDTSIPPDLICTDSEAIFKGFPKHKWWKGRWLPADISIAVEWCWLFVEGLELEISDFLLSWWLLWLLVFPILRNDNGNHCCKLRLENNCEGTGMKTESYLLNWLSFQPLATKKGKQSLEFIEVQNLLMMNIFLSLVKVQSYFGTIGLTTMMDAIWRGFLDPDFKRI